MYINEARQTYKYIDIQTLEHSLFKKGGSKNQ